MRKLSPDESGLVLEIDFEPLAGARVNPFGFGRSFRIRGTHRLHFKVYGAVQFSRNEREKAERLARHIVVCVAGRTE